MKKVITLSFILLLTACGPLDSATNSAKRDTLGNLVQIEAKNLQQDFSIKKITDEESKQDITEPTPCISNDLEEGQCTYTLLLNGDEAEFTVKIEGKGKYEGITAISVNGNESTVTDINE